MIRVPMLEDQISQSEFFYEKICLVLFSQTNFDCMWQEKERQERSDLYLDSNLDDIAALTAGRRIDSIHKMPEGLLECFELTDKPPRDAKVASGGHELPDSVGCTCEVMLKVDLKEDNEKKYVCKTYAGCGTCLSPDHNQNNESQRPIFWKCERCSRTVCTRCLNATVFLNKLRVYSEMDKLKNNLKACKYFTIAFVTPVNCRQLERNVRSGLPSGSQCQRGV